MCLAMRACIMKRIALLSLTLLAASFAMGCTIRSSSYSSDSSTSGPSSSTQNITEHSSSLETYELSASMSAQSDGTTLKIYAAVFDASTSQGVTLDQGDFFTASTGAGDPLVLVLEASSDPSVVHYSASLPASTSAQDVTIAFVRQNGQTSAPQTLIHVPAPFNLTTTGSTSVNFGDPLSIQATPAPTGDTLLEATGSCLYSSDYDENPNTFWDELSFDGNGNAQIPTGVLILANEGTSSEACSISFFVSAVNEGSLDPAFAGGATGGQQDIEGSQKRGVVASVTP